MNIGYIRVSTEEQNTIRQEVLMKELGVEKIFMDKASGKNAQREELKKMMDFARQGDTVASKDTLLNALDNHSLAPQIIEDIHTELPKRQDIDPDWSMWKHPFICSIQ